MKYSVAVILVIVAVASAEPPRNGGFLARQQAEQPPYQARGFRPAGPVFDLAFRSQKQQLPPTPAASYGPPEESPAEPITTTETSTTTEFVTLEPQQTESSRVAPTNQKLTEDPMQEGKMNAAPAPAAFYVVVPQGQNLVYVSARLAVQQPRLLPVQAIPAFAKIQEVPQFARIQDYQAVTPIATVQVASSAYTSFVSTPYSSSFIQSFQ